MACGLGHRRGRPYSGAQMAVECRECKWTGRRGFHTANVKACPNCGRHAVYPKR